MSRKKIVPAIIGTIEYLEPEENSHFDKFKIIAENQTVGFLYMPKLSFLSPRRITFTREVEILTEY